METSLYFLICNKSNLKKCLREPNSVVPQQVLCHGSVQGACWVSERFDSSPEPCEAEGCQAWHWGHGHTLCTVTGHSAGSVQAGSALGSGLSLQAAACQTNGSATVIEDFRMVLCVLRFPVSPSPLLNHLWIYHFSKVLQKGWTACAFVTNHPVL